ncbi:hypothetical protein Zm00014a_037343 [Zea mays]|uniref:Uncharacterized protein n=1 Tax=Zea mays TaxID=4577 RepID=A0A3L6ERY6_MAIZE|nr:hypothetical protein Zm00014a_037343 [Zea mays]
MCTGFLLRSAHFFLCGQLVLFWGQLRKWTCATLGKWGWFEFWLQ